MTFNTLISASTRVRDINRAFAVFKTMTVHYRLVPDRSTFNALIDACGKAGFFDRALDLLQRMRVQGLQPCAVTYNALLDACGRNRMFDKAMELFENMAKEGVEPDVYTLNTLIAVCCRCGKLDDAFSILRRLKEKSLKPDEVTYNTLIDAVGKSGGLDYAFELTEEMKRSGKLPLVVTVSVHAAWIWWADSFFLPVKLSSLLVCRTTIVRRIARYCDVQFSGAFLS